jgi:hypothetical protein
MARIHKFNPQADLSRKIDDMPLDLAEEPMDLLCGDEPARLPFRRMLAPREVLL